MRHLILILLAFTAVAACDQTKPPVTLHPADNPPTRLSDWGIVMTRGGYFELNDGVMRYTLNTPLFTDYALKLRTVWMPSGSTATYSAEGPVDFPIGTIISKTFHYEKAGACNQAECRVKKDDRESTLDSRGRLRLSDYVIVETRLLIRYDDGWKALPYVWNDAQDDAILEIAGDIRQLVHVTSAAEEKFTYIVPDANQCAGCHVTNHASKQLQPIGPKAWQLNRDYRYGQQEVNQLEHWATLGLLTGLPENRPIGVNWSEPGVATLEQRAKAYLDINCAHCHNEAGAADTSALDLDLGTPVSRDFGICKPPVAVGRGSGNRPFDIYPGRPDDSILLYRLQHTDPAIAMPELGRSTVHSEGVALLRAWITEMGGECRGVSELSSRESKVEMDPNGNSTVEST